MADPAARYAIYFAPHPGNPWWAMLSRWLGYDAATGREVDRLPVPCLDRDILLRVTDHPRRYGAHATLKAPFRLAMPHAEADLVCAVDEYAAGQSAFPLPPLRVEQLSNFIALTPSEPDGRINGIADACTTRFDRFRAPLCDAEMARRLLELLDPVSLSLLQQWGYPHVLEKYRFHMSLTGTLDGESQRTVREIRRAAHDIFDGLGGQAPDFDAICIFRQASAADRFILTHRAPFAS